MVLESILNPKIAEQKPYVLILIGFLYSSVAFLLSTIIFEGQASLVSVFLIVFAAVPLFYNTMKYEEKKDETLLREKEILKEHFKAFRFFMSFFLGVCLAYTFFYLFLPQRYLIQLFSSQIDTIVSINGKLTATTSMLNNFTAILTNNLKVLSLCILFAFLYGAGAIFILTWNASVLGVAMGQLMRRTLSSIGGPFSYFQAFSLGIVRYFIHGIPEILAYFVAGMAGSLISYASIKYSFQTKKYKKILYDASLLVVISIALIFLAAFLEVFVTGSIFN